MSWVGEDEAQILSEYGGSGIEMTSIKLLPRALEESEGSIGETSST